MVPCPSGVSNVKGATVLSTQRRDVNEAPRSSWEIRGWWSSAHSPVFRLPPALRRLRSMFLRRMSCEENYEGSSDELEFDLGLGDFGDFIQLGVCLAIFHGHYCTFTGMFLQF